MPSIPPQCQALSDQYDALQQQRADLQAQLQGAAPGEKAALVSHIKHLNFLMGAKKADLDACVAQHAGPPGPGPLASSLTGTVTITTNRAYPDEPFADAVKWNLLFDAARTQVFLTSFTPWLIATSALANAKLGAFAGIFGGTDVTTIRATSIGASIYIKPAGFWALPLTLHFDHSLDVPIIVEDSDLSVMLSTSNPGGSPISASGALTLAGSGLMTGGWFGGDTFTISVTGTLSPIP